MAFAVKFAAGAAALAVLGAASSAWAIKPPPTLIDWTLSDGTFDDGGTFSGTFIFNTVTDTITSWNISTTALVDDTSGGLVGGIFVPLIYSSPGGCLFIFCSSASDNGSGPTFENDVVFLSTTFNLTNITLGAPGVVDSLTGNESGFAFPIGPFSHDVTGGTAVGVAGVPEPAAWALMILGFGGVGATLRRRRTVSAIA